MKTHANLFSFTIPLIKTLESVERFGIGWRKKDATNIPVNQHVDNRTGNARHV